MAPPFQPAAPSLALNESGNAIEFPPEYQPERNEVPQSPQKRVPVAPKGLEAAGRRLWKATLAEFEPGPAELELLESLCRAVDRARVAEQLVADDGPTVLDRFGAAKPHPALAALRDATNLMRQLARQLGLKLAEDAEAKRPPRPGPYKHIARRQALARQQTAGRRLRAVGEEDA